MVFRLANRLSHTALGRKIKRNPFVFFGIPFLLTMGLAPYGLQHLTQVRYDIHDSKVRMLEKKEELGIDKKAAPVNVQEIYWNLTHKKDMDDWDFVRVPRPKDSGEE
ncbi:cytochrome c oxidase assembly protein COX16-domain-containing protein [Polychytrium aggregatum]|uniref:cytochrome c oxidase assembly protein COX16-domain-containing protein n=1 Tax=Polychytrium aggregatum TaxID=110093 RepID=UPI0022FF0A78|nr:cytochrome c oxidase assembly protein COX16-domain-containing protein [Polychytrium aggregatum]KAI9203691.1 cytochrome c oxidase assembly protein COX16-domain-containing protein [Polychytrium aggregatum]